MAETGGCVAAFCIEVDDHIDALFLDAERRDLERAGRVIRPLGSNLRVLARL
jgi:hypothetical protein